MSSPHVRKALLGLLDSFGMNALAFGSVAELVAHHELDLPACLILDLELPDMSGLDFQAWIAQGGATRQKSVKSN